jgi:hypothetical protein
MIFLLEVEQHNYCLSHLIIMPVVPMGEDWFKLLYGLNVSDGNISRMMTSKPSRKMRLL